MRVLIQRVKEASVTVDNEVISLIHNGLLVFIGITDDDTREDIQWLTKKIANIRIFDDEDGVMNRSVIETGGDILAVSQFTLMASTKRVTVRHISRLQNPIYLFRFMRSSAARWRLL